LPAAALTRTAPLNNKGYRWVADHRSWFGRRIPDRAKRRADALIAERSTPHIT
jgi:predicted DCC family thiol-disulfide oxidoreductase YuxK